jgi:hypothetical protein
MGRANAGGMWYLCRRLVKRGETVTSINMSPTAGAFVDVKADFLTSGNGQEDHRERIRSALAAAAAENGPGVVWFPPGVSPQESDRKFCPDVPDSNIQLHGVKGRSWMKARAGLTRLSTFCISSRRRTSQFAIWVSTATGGMPGRRLPRAYTPDVADTHTLCERHD